MNKQALTQKRNLAYFSYHFNFGFAICFFPYLRLKEKYDSFTARPTGLWNEYIIVNILSIFCNLRSCGYGYAVITVTNSDIACDATLQGKILSVTKDFK